MVGVMGLSVADSGRNASTSGSDAEARSIARIAEGDRQAFTDLYVRHRLTLLHYLLHFTTDRGLAEEVLQDTFVVVWQQAGKFQRRSRVQAWLFGIARRRLWKALSHASPDLVDLETLDALAAPDSDPVEAVLSVAAQEDLAAAIERLSPLHREVLLLSYVHELTYQELADILAVPMGTVKSRLNNAKRALRRFVTTSGEDASWD